MWPCFVGLSRTCPDRQTWFMGLWESQLCLSISRPKAPTLWSRTTLTRNSGRPSTRTVALRTLFSAHRRESWGWGFMLAFRNATTFWASVVNSFIGLFYVSVIWTYQISSQGRNLFGHFTLFTSLFNVSEYEVSTFIPTVPPLPADNNPQTHTIHLLHTEPKQRDC